MASGVSHSALREILLAGHKKFWGATLNYYSPPREPAGKTRQLCRRYGCVIYVRASAEGALRFMPYLSGRVRQKPSSADEWRRNKWCRAGSELKASVVGRGYGLFDTSSRRFR